MSDTTVENKQSPQKSPTKKDIDTATKALNLLAQGKRHLLVSDIQSAVNSLQEACSLLAEHYGELAPECGDAYFYYGRALLEMARIESGVIGNALDGVPDGDDLENSQVENPDGMTDEERELVTEKVDQALEENFILLEKKPTTATQNGHATNGAEKGQSEALSNGNEVEMAQTPVESGSPVKDNKDESSKSEKEEVKESTKVDTKESPKEDAKESLKEESKKSEETKVVAEKSSEQKEESKETKTKEASKEESHKTESDSSKVKELSEKEKVEPSSDKVNGHSTDESMEVDSERKESGEDSQDGEGSASDGEQQEGEEDSQDGEEDGEESASQEEEGEKTEEEEDISNLQLAWEMLELAKVVFQKQTDKPNMDMKIAQVHLKLGEVSLENENYGQAFEDFDSCLKIQVEKLKPDDRCLAETHYQMGVAHSLSDDFDKAIESFKGASDVIETRISNLKKRIEEKSKWSEEQKKAEALEKKDPFYTEENEIEELEKILPEMKEKLVDMEQMKKDCKEKIAKAKETAFATIIGGASSSASSNPFDAPSCSSSATSSSLEVSNISHLMKKKRKPDEVIEKEEPKKTKVDDKVITNGAEKNGIHKSPEKMQTEESVKKSDAVSAKSTDEVTSA